LSEYLTVSKTVFRVSCILADVAVRNAKAAEKPRKMADGQGLYLLLTTTGVRSWRMTEASLWLGEGSEQLGLSVGVEANAF
jgi:hypothetical protein